MEEGKKILLDVQIERCSIDGSMVLEQPHKDGNESSKDVPIRRGLERSSTGEAEDVDEGFGSLQLRIASFSWRVGLLVEVLDSEKIAGRWRRGGSK